VPFWKTLYCTVQFAPGVEAFHDRLTLLLLLEGELRPVGTLGRVLQVPPPPPPPPPLQAPLSTHQPQAGQ
jgi:hypothetical protein